MTNSRVIWALWLAAVLPVWSQVGGVSVEVSLNQNQFLPAEELQVAVRVVNRSGQTLQLGAEENWIQFSVISSENHVVARNGAPSVAGEFELPSSKAAIKRVDIAPYFLLRQPGRYQVSASVYISAWDKMVSSEPAAFDILTGTLLKEITFGVPAPAGASNAPPETRKYILQQAPYLKQMKLYLRITDASNTRMFKVFPLANMVSFSSPEAQVDRWSNLHVFHQVGMRSFHYGVVNPDGEIIVRQRHDYSRTRPSLRTDDEGNIRVIGGVRRPTSDDIPGDDTPLSQPPPTTTDRPTNAAPKNNP